MAFGRNAGHFKVIIGIFYILTYLNLSRYISYVLPQTFACQALRGVMSRGWGLEWLPVYRGFFVTIAWIVGLLALSAIILRVRR